MTHGIKMACLALTFGIVCVLGTGCTSMLHDDNARYVKKSREFQRLRQRLEGTYVGIDTCRGRLCEIYQFESPFRTSQDPHLLEVLIPVYGVSEKDPIQIYETTRQRSGEQSADLRVWDNLRELEPVPKKSLRRRQLDIVWTGEDDCTLRRSVPNDPEARVDKWQAELTIPWNKRSRINYALRNCAYVGTVSADIVAGAGVVVAGAGYVTLLACVYCPCGVSALIQAID